VLTGKWVAQDAGIGAGVDSYFEYLVKGAILLQDKKLMAMFLGKREGKGLPMTCGCRCMELYKPGTFCQEPFRVPVSIFKVTVGCPLDVHCTSSCLLTRAN
jgi:hypothetical protein